MNDTTRPDQCVCAEVAEIVGNHLNDATIISLCDLLTARLAEAEGALARVQALAAASPIPASPYPDVRDEAMWGVGYTAAQTDVLAALVSPAEPGEGGHA